MVHYSATSSALAKYAVVGRGVKVTVTNTGNVYHTFCYGFDPNGLAQYPLAPGQTKEITDCVPSAANSISTIESPVFWSGLSSSNTQVTGNAAAKTYKWYFKWDAGAVSSGLDVPIAASTVQVTYSASGPWPYQAFAQAPLTCTLNYGDAAPTVTDGQARKELYLTLWNKSDHQIDIQWGNTTLHLAPGGNIIRYDGPVTASGMPAVCPSDFPGSAVLYTGSDGTSYVGAIIGQSPGAPPSWQPAPVLPPTLPTTNPDRPQLVVTPAVPPKGPGVNMFYGDGQIAVTQWPPVQVQTPSNTTGGGAVISDPTQPKPPQTTNNTTTNVTNNTVNNTTVNNVTTINNYSDSPGSNYKQADALTADGSLTQDSRGKPTGDLPGALSSARSAVSSKFGASSFQLLAAGSIPKVMTYPIDINLGNMGSIHKVIDFSQMPFPPVRAALLAMMTIGFGVAFMKKVTI